MHSIFKWLWTEPRNFLLTPAIAPTRRQPYKVLRFVAADRNRPWKN